MRQRHNSAITDAALTNNFRSVIVLFSVVLIVGIEDIISILLQVFPFIV